jgi:pimeloyl-ACP methyl ester carboxylesterase
MTLEFMAGGEQPTVNVYVRTFMPDAEEVQGLTLAGDTVAFFIGTDDARFNFSLTRRRNELSGWLEVAGGRYPVRLTSDDVPEAHEPRRPQLPREPFPYDEEDVSFKSGDVQIAGTLTLPRSCGPVPAVVLVSGSGPQTRDYYGDGHMRFVVLADSLARAGIAVLRFDDRGVGLSDGDFDKSTLQDSAADLAAAVALLAKRADVAPTLIGLIGHSEGGEVAAFAALGSRDVAFVAMLASPGLSWQDRYLAKIEEQVKEIRFARDFLGRWTDYCRGVTDLAKTGELDADEIRRKAHEGLDRLLLHLDPDDRPPVDDMMRPAVDGMVSLCCQTRIRSFLQHDLDHTLRQISVPVLVVHGTHDNQLPIEPHLERLERALRASPKCDLTVRRIVGLNHMLQTSAIGEESEYARIEETISPAVLGAVSQWLTRVGGATTK